MRTLILNQSYEATGTIGWQKAVAYVFLKKAIVLEEYDREIRSMRFSMKVPSVIVLKSHKVHKPKAVRYSRKNVWLRDEGKCQYCNKDVKLADFTIDHVHPKTNGGKTTWENVVTSCYKCNQAKAEKAVHEAGLKLKKIPKKPSHLPLISEASGFYDENFTHPTWNFWLGRKTS